MTSIICETVVFVADQGLAGGALAGSGALIVSLFKLVAELHASKEMCQDLINHLKAVQSQLESMLKNDNITISRSILTEYHNLLEKVEIFLQNHVTSKLWTRVTNHWKMKEQVQQFYVDLKKIETRLDLKFHEEAANRHGEISSMLCQHQKIEKQAQTALGEDIRALENQMKMMPQDIVAALGSDRFVTVADLKHELKNHNDMYTKEQVQQLKRIFRKVIAIVPDSHQSRWYLSRSDFRFDDRSPFATGKFRSIHYGTLVSGTEVTIKTVVVEKGDKKTREAFRKEVETWYSLRDPHVLPLYGANDLGSPLLFVCGRAERGNFNDYLKTQPQRFWQIFLDAARGLAYLHKQKCIHGNLKCSNLLVTKHGVGVLSDFGFSFVRENSALSLKEQAPDYFWKAPECFNLENDNKRFESDIYALGICIFEAMSGTLPFADLAEQAATDRIRNGELPAWPEGTVTAEAWSLITRMCCRNFQDRLGLRFVIAELQVLAAQEEMFCSRLACNCKTGRCFECGGQRRVSSDVALSEVVLSGAKPTCAAA